ncbi:MAG: Trk system potassium transporter TrkA [Clostridia bacterium]|nr:Trk system potassium transporter TrkA [Clostridia bacterium]
MKVIVVGCGKIGKAIIESMAEERHDVVAIDNDPQVIEQIANTFDVMAVCGSATSREMLQKANVSKTDLFISVTESDEVNMLSCFLAKRMGAKYTVARIRETEYNNASLQYLIKELGLSMALNPELLTAQSLYDILKLPSAVNVDNFAGKMVQLLEIVVTEDSPIANKTLQDLRQKSSVPFVACAVQRGEEVYIPTGTFQLEEDDKVAFMVKRSDSNKFVKSCGLAQKQGKDVLIMGGSKVACYLAKLLASNGFSAKIIEKDPEKCEKIAEIVSSATVICGDGMSQDVLWEEGIRSTDAFVALTGNDEENILMSFYCMSEKVPKVICKVSHQDLTQLAEKLGLYSTVCPQKYVADTLTRYARALNNNVESKVETMYNLMDGKAEALEFVVLGDSSIIETPLKDLNLKPNFIIAGIIRGQETIIPSGSDCINVGDRVIVVATDEHLYDLSDIVR